MKTKTITTYSLEELTGPAKERALDTLANWAVDGEWWDGTYDDAENIGMKITGFDIDRASYVKADIPDCFETANLIVINHGEVCDTFKLASAFLAEYDKLRDEWSRDENGDMENEGDFDDKADEMENEFRQALCEDYRIMLTHEYEYLTSEESLLEMAEANDYQFDENGRIA